MAIYSRFGSEVEIVDYDRDPLDADMGVEVKRDDGSVIRISIFDLKADGGMSEIHKAMKALD